MQVETELRDMFSYSLTPIFITIILLVIVYSILYKKKNEENTNMPKVIIPTPKNLLNIKYKYINKINTLLRNYNENKITSRKAYQALSNIIRNFIYESTNIRVQNYTLKEIKEINIPILYELVSEYYDPEFAKYSNGNIINSINKTRMVIERWN